MNSPLLSLLTKFAADLTAKTALIAIICFLAVPPSSAADAGPVPGGVYTLSKISGGSLIVLGTLEIRGKTYRVGEEGDFAAFSQDSAGKIIWSAGLDIMPDGWTLGTSTYTGLNPQGQPFIKIHYVSARGAAEVIDCVKE